MVYNNYESQNSFEKHSTLKKVIIFGVIVVVFFSVVYMAASLLSAPSDQSQGSEEHTALTLALYQSANYYNQEGVAYEFMYVSGGQGNLLQVSLGGQTLSYSAVSGATCEPFDLKVVIYSANENMLVVHIRSQ